MATRKSDPGTDSRLTEIPASSPRSRSSGPAPSMSINSGRVRDALAAVRNFETLMRSSSVEEALLASVLSEIGNACATLRDAFLQTPATYDRLAAFALRRIDELDQLLTQAVPTTTSERIALGDSFIAKASADLAAAAELLDLAERSQSPAPIELPLAMLARESLQMALALRAEATADVQVSANVPDAVVVCDPQIASRVIALAVSIAYKPSGSALMVTTEVLDRRAIVRVEPRDEPASPRVAVRVLRLIEPTEDVATRAAAAAGIDLRRDGDAIVITLPLH